MLLTLLQTITYYSNLRYFAQPLGHFVQSLVSNATSLRGAGPDLLYSRAPNFYALNCLEEAFSETQTV